MMDILDDGHHSRHVQPGKETFVSYAKTGEADVISSVFGCLVRWILWRASRFAK